MGVGAARLLAGEAGDAGEAAEAFRRGTALLPPPPTRAVPPQLVSICACKGAGVECFTDAATPRARRSL